MTDLVILGAGGLGREIAAMVAGSSLGAQYRIVGFADDALAPGTQVGRWTVLCAIDGVAELGPISVVLALGDPELKTRIYQRIQGLPLRFPTLIHPSVHNLDPARNRIGQGCVLSAGVALTTEIEIGDFVLLNLNTTVGHNARIGSYSSLMPGVHLSGNVALGVGVMIGTGACLLQHSSVGARSKIGAGAVVTHSIPPDTTAVGIPARPLDQKSGSI